MTPQPTVQMPCPIRGDAHDTMLGSHGQAAGSVISVSRNLYWDRPGPGRNARAIGGRGPSRRGAAVTMPARLTLGTDLQKYKWHRNRILPGIACNTGFETQFCPRFKFRMAATCISATGANPCTRVSHHIPPCRGRRKGDFAAGCETGRPSAEGGRLLVVAAANAHHGDGLLAGEVGFVVADTGVVELHQRASPPRHRSC